MLLDDKAGGRDAGVQQGLEPLIAIGGKVQNALVGRNSEGDAAGQAGRATLHVGDIRGRGNVQHVTGSVNDSAGDRNGTGISGAAGFGGRSAGERTTALTENDVDETRLWKHETIASEGGHLPLFLIIIVELANVGTGRGSGAHVGEAAVALKRIGAGIGQVANICADGEDKIGGDLRGRIPGDEVAANDIAGVPGGVDENAIQVSTDLVPLDQVVVAYANQSYAEIVARGCGGSRKTSAVSVESVQPNSVVIAVRDSSSAAGVATRMHGVPDGEISFNVAVSGGNQDDAAETVVRRGDSLDPHFSRLDQGDSKNGEFLHQPRSKDGHVVLANRINAIGRCGGGAIGGASRDAEAVEAELDTRGTKGDARGVGDRTGDVAHELAVIGDDHGVRNGAHDVRSPRGPCA